MVSKQKIIIIGLELTVYGLEEYKKLPEPYPASVLFALHGRFQSQSSMTPISEALCSLNVHPDFAKRHLIVVTFDSPNHGSRLINKEANHDWSKNPNHALDMWNMINSTARTVSDLIDVIEHYLFGPLDRHRVEVWGVTGFSMGGHASFLAAAEDPRITVAMPIVGSADFLSLMKDRLDQTELPSELHLPSAFCQTVAVKTANFDERLKSKHLLIINGANDKMVKPEFNQNLVDRLHKIHQGKEGLDWAHHILPKGHEWSDKTVKLCLDWTDYWMLIRERAKI